MLRKNIYTCSSWKPSEIFEWWNIRDTHFLCLLPESVWPSEDWLWTGWMCSSYTRSGSSSLSHCVRCQPLGRHILLILTRTSDLVSRIYPEVLIENLREYLLIHTLYYIDMGKLWSPNSRNMKVPTKLKNERDLNYIIGFYPISLLFLKLLDFSVFSCLSSNTTKNLHYSVYWKSWQA